MISPSSHNQPRPPKVARFPSRVTQGHHIGPQRQGDAPPQRRAGGAPGQPGEAAAVADDVRLQAAVKHGPGAGRAGGLGCPEQWAEPERIAFKSPWLF